ncbi:hypothetical protein [Bradyrhizobium sp. STM 3561]|uniref:hypothetical protein n=1 Tax=Bradyrhizobium sp. STM 3561 TaxID=578923 RepID=UPI00388D5417
MPVLAAAGYNFHRIICKLELLLRQILVELNYPLSSPQTKVRVLHRRLGGL